MYLLTENAPELVDWLEAEITLSQELAAGSSGMPARRVQEWLSLSGRSLVIDDDYGTITAKVVADFQRAVGLPSTGRVNQATFTALVAPLRASLAPRPATSLNAAVVAYARGHLEQHPREIGGENSGPWVRAYTGGNQGPAWLWCAGFVTFVLKQATESLAVRMPIAGSVSCDALASQAKAAGLFVPQSEASERVIPPGSLFLCRASDNDWSHVGFVTECQQQLFETIEGNTNDDGLREGYEVCARSRGYKNIDFILLSR